MRNYLLLFAGCVAFHLIGTWTLPMIDRDEPRFAEASREMRQRNDYVVPYFNGNYRFDKPPLTYWAQVASFTAFGENDFAARFPSVIATALTAVCLFAWASRSGSNQLAWWSVIIFTLCLQTFVHAKAAVADMWLVLFMTAAHWSGWELLGSEQTPNIGRRTPNAEGQRTGMLSSWWLIFYCSLALAFLAKGPIGLTPILTVLLFAWFTGRSEMLRAFAFGRGLLLLIAIIALWGVPAYLRTNGEFLRIGIGRHVIGRSVGAMEGHGGGSVLIYFALLPFYFVTVFVSFFPWSIKLPWLTGRLWKERDRFDVYLLCGAGVVFFIFTLVATKLPHYTLPAFPLLAILLARHWNSGNQTRSFRNMTIAITIFWIAIALTLPPLIAPLFPSWALFQKARTDLRPEMEFAAVDYNEPSLVWYFRSRVNGFLTSFRKKDAAPFIAKAGPRFIIVPDSVANDVFKPPSDWKRFSTKGFNLVKGKKVELTLFLKSE